MKKIKNYAGMLDAYYSSRAALDLYDAYERPSAAKVRAWNDCRRLCEDLGGHGLRVTGWNSSIFSAAFLYDGPRGEACMCYITKGNRYFFDVSTGEEEATHGAPNTADEIANLRVIQALTPNPTTRKNIERLIEDLKKATSSRDIASARFWYNVRQLNPGKYD